MPAALLVMGGTGMALHYEVLSKIIGGVPPILAVGHPISGKSTAVAAALSLLDQRESIGGNNFSVIIIPNIIPNEVGFITWFGS